MDIPLYQHLLTVKANQDQHAISISIEALLNETKPAWTKHAKRIGIDEAKQIAMMAIWESAQSYEHDPSRPNVGGYVATFVSRRLITDYNHTQVKKRKANVTSLDAPRLETETLHSVIEDHRSSATDDLEHVERFEILSKYLQVYFSADAVKLLVMLSSGHSYNEIGEAIGLNKKSVDNLRMRTQARAKQLGLDLDTDTLIRKLTIRVREDSKGSVFHYPKQYSQWRVVLSKNRKRKYIGCYETEEDARISAAAIRHRSADAVYWEQANKLNKHGLKGVQSVGIPNQFFAYYKGKYLGTFPTAREAHNQYLRARKGKDYSIQLKGNKTGYRGVQVANNKYAAVYRHKHLGVFETAEEAHAAYLAAKNANEQRKN